MKWKVYICINIVIQAALPSKYEIKIKRWTTDTFILGEFQENDII